MAEHGIHKPGVVGSIPTSATVLSGTNILDNSTIASSIKYLDGPVVNQLSHELVKLE